MQAYRRQLQSMRNLERRWEVENDPTKFKMLRSMYCFGLCLGQYRYKAPKEASEKPKV